ncbi:MAG: hypothetical protein MRY83_08745 [Flavobacteriales bacterium]|nr:hypothetical protein [Flavobacteriales bacterium]
MGARSKGRRKFNYNGRQFYWYFKLTDDWMYSYPNPQLHVISDDKKFIVSYQPLQTKENRFLIIKGPEFGGLEYLHGPWRRTSIPVWEDEIITPQFIRDLLDWCFDESPKQLVDYRGNNIVPQNF